MIFSRGRWPYSLKATCVWAIAAGASLAYLALLRDYTAQQSEIAQLREELGYFTVDDPNKVYIRAVPIPADNGWIMNIHLPPSGEWEIHSAFDTILSQGYPDDSWPRRPVEGNFSLLIHISKDQFDEYQLTLGLDPNPRQINGEKPSAKKSKLPPGTWLTSRWHIPEELAQRSVTCAGSKLHVAGSPRLEVLAPLDKIEMLRLQTPVQLYPAEDVAENAPGLGILIWLEKREPQP